MEEVKKVTRRRKKKNKELYKYYFRLAIIAAFILLFIWSLFTIILQSGLFKDRRNSGELLVPDASTEYHQKA
ncbi:MAG: hypothetical protein WCL14_14965 [Bacteroidota bacterium]